VIRKAPPQGPLLALLLATLTVACSDRAVDGDGSPRAPRTVPVVAEAVSIEQRRTRIEAVGTARARRSVSVFAETAGEVVSVDFQPGDRVEAGAVLVALDSREEELALELAEVRYAEARRLLNRYATANDGVALTVPETTVDAATTTLESARIERDRARLALERRFVTAPFSGYVGITDVDAGDRIEPTTEITTLDDRGALLVSFDVPEVFVGRVNIGDPVAIEVWSADRTRAEGRVVDLGSRVDPVSRAFVARAEVPNPGDMLRPGMSFRVQLDLLNGEFPVVPEVAVQWGADGAYVWSVQEGRARRVPVRLVQRVPGKVLVEGPLGREDRVVAEGVQSMREGVGVRLLDAAALARDARAALEDARVDG
jgi:membrane fusion protein (multidrug efflux system)